MTNIMTELTAYVNTLDLYTRLSIDAYKGDNEEILIRHEPSSAKVQSYMDGSRVGEFNFSLKTKSQDAEKAVSQLSTLITKLDIRSDLSLTDLIRIKIEPVTAVRFVTKTDNLEYIYSADFRLEYEETRS